MYLTIRPEDLRPGVTLVDVLALLRDGADAAVAAASGASPSDLAEGSQTEPDEGGHVPGAMVEGPQPPIDVTAEEALPIMMAGASGAVPSPAQAAEPAPASSPALPERAELIGLARTALQGGRRDAVKTLLERAGVKRMSEIPDERLTDAIEELKELLS